jgi:hypothetical protein
MALGCTNPRAAAWLGSRDVSHQSIVRTTRPVLAVGYRHLIATAIAAPLATTTRMFFQLPAITYGCSHEHAAFPGAVSISATTLAAVNAESLAIRASPRSSSSTHTAEMRS